MSDKFGDKSIDKDSKDVTTDKDNKNNGLITKIWGPHLWESIHSITFGFPIEPTEEQKQDYMNFFKYLGKVMPCVYCRNSYGEFTTTGKTAIVYEIFENRDTLTKWGYDLHNIVNNKLGFDYGTTYEDLVNKYESYRAKCVKNEKGCIMPLNLKADSYRKGDRRNAPLISSDIVNKFMVYSLIRGYDMRPIFEKTQQLLEKGKNNEAWDVRNDICWKIIKKMRNNAIPCVEKTGEYQGLPTKHELKLFSLMSTTISSCEFENIYKKLDEFNKKY